MLLEGEFAVSLATDEDIADADHHTRENPGYGITQHQFAETRPNGADEEHPGEAQDAGAKDGEQGRFDTVAETAHRGGRDLVG